MQLQKAIITVEKKKKKNLLKTTLYSRNSAALSAYLARNTFQQGKGFFPLSWIWTFVPAKSVFFTYFYFKIKTNSLGCTEFNAETGKWSQPKCISANPISPFPICKTSWASSTKKKKKITTRKVIQSCLASIGFRNTIYFWKSSRKNYIFLNSFPFSLYKFKLGLKLQ